MTDATVSPDEPIDVHSGTASDYVISKDASADRYVAHLGDEPVGFVSYSENGLEVTIDHTVVDTPHQGKGVAARLVKFALDDLGERTEKRIMPICWYARKWVDRNPEYKELTRRKS